MAHVFIVDSSPAVQRLVKQSAGAAYDIHSFGEGGPALEAAAKLKPSVIIADYHLDDVPIVSFCERLAGLELLPKTKIVLLVTAADRFDEEELRYLGVKSFLQKPLDPEDLLHTLKQVEREPAKAHEEEKGPAKRKAQAAEAADHTAAPSPVSPASPVIDPAEVKAQIEKLVKETLPDVLRPLVDQTERKLAQELPDMVDHVVKAQIGQVVKDELTALLPSLAPREQLMDAARGVATTSLPHLVNDAVGNMEPKIKEALIATAERLIAETTERLARASLEQAVRAQLPQTVKEQLGAVDALVREQAEAAAARQAGEIARQFVQHLSQVLVEGLNQQATGKSR
jgi:CheY-like chemotaxis protein